MIISIIIAVLVFILLIFFRYRKESEEIYGTLSAFKTMITVATDDEEVRHIERSLRSYIKRKCWHRYHMDYANEILSYISGRRNPVNKESK